MKAEPTALDLVELDLDFRLLSLWLQAWDVERWNHEIVAPFLRLSYWNGYQDALTESRRGKLLRDHRQHVPTRKRRDGAR